MVLLIRSAMSVLIINNNNLFSGENANNAHLICFIHLQESILKLTNHAHLQFVFWVPDTHTVTFRRPIQAHVFESHYIFTTL